MLAGAIIAPGYGSRAAMRWLRAVTQINNIWGTYGLPTGTNNIVVVATDTSGTAQIRG